ncbi:MAG: alpha/beta hydrolase [Phreatobacter sp.]|jgi:sigma-B regulation protein RsbQ|nr:alpha/beta hydrolase [Phreatobacter sp.]
MALENVSLSTARLPNPLASDGSSNAVKRRHAIRVVGSGSRPMVFAHGFGCDQNMWKALVPAFQDDFRIILFDHVGAGQSDLAAFDPARYATLDGYAEDVLTICEALDLRDVVFVGHSVSASIGIRAALLQPERFSDLVLIGPSPCYLDDGDYRGGFSVDALEEMLELLSSNFLGWSSAMAPAIMGNPERPDLAAELEESFCRTDPGIAAHFARVTFFSDTRDDLPRMGKPALVLQCSQDVIASEVVGRYVADHLPRGRFVQLAATGHCPHVSHPEEVVAQMRRYLSDANGRV